MLNTEQETMLTIPLIAHEVIVAKHRLKEKKLIIALIVTVIIAIVSHFLIR